MFLIKVANENQEIYENGHYMKSGNKVEIKEMIEKSIEGTEYFEDITLTMPRVKNYNVFKVSDAIQNIGTMDCAIRLRNQGEEGNIIALNFASATRIGGGYLTGSTSQEESLCRASMLYQTLLKHEEFYKKHKANYTPLYSDRMIYSPGVPVVRNDNGDLLDKPLTCSFITSAAVNKKKISVLDKNYKNIESVMDERIKKIILLALSKNPSVIILGAFGCGAFGNDRDTIYRLFEKHINALVPIDKIKVIFAVRKNVSKR